MTDVSSAAKPFVSVIIPHLNDHDRLALCLEHLHAQTWPRDRYEVIVVDNGSQRPIDEVVARFPLSRASFEAERGCGSARNRGVAESKGEILLFTDSDVLPAPDWIERAVHWLTQGDADIVGGRVRVFPKDPANPTDVELYEQVFAFQNWKYIQRKNFTVGCCILTRREVYDRVGPFRNGNLPEDMEWGHRATAMGLRIRYAPDVLLSHPARHHWHELTRKMDRTTFHYRSMWRERSGRMFWVKWALFTAALAVPPVDKLWEVFTCRNLDNTQQKMRAARVLLALRYYRVRRMVEHMLRPDVLLQEFKV
ncbi:glycosyltransferase family 2 protein [Telmatospirillum sp. J64-1]|uniref:glycosyltransferase n=1 Tax=Telmatospirillum sp. J64-1 TaxID=2502183 RepID=UPI00115E9DDA|nr:glycosyltransferase [Telmatospirillum sp. J64-1]